MQFLIGNRWHEVHPPTPLQGGQNLHFFNPLRLFLNWLSPYIFNQGMALSPLEGGRGVIKNVRALNLLALTFFALGVSLSASASTTLPPVHDIHLSKCVITYQEEEKSLDIQWHIWLDDLALALENFGVGDLKLLTGQDVEDADEKLMKYLQTKMTLKINGIPTPFTWKKKEASEDLLAVWVHLEVKNVETLKSIKVQNNILMEIYNDQQNIVHLKGTGGRQGYLIFEKEEQEEEIIF